MQTTGVFIFLFVWLVILWGGGYCAGSLRHGKILRRLFILFLQLAIQVSPPGRRRQSRNIQIAAYRGLFSWLCGDYSLSFLNVKNH